MARKSYTPEQIINKLREVEILLNQGANVSEACRKIGVTEQTYYRWHREYNHFRHHSALGYRPPVPEAKLHLGHGCLGALLLSLFPLLLGF
jgi:transposase-like protein